MTDLSLEKQLKKSAWQIHTMGMAYQDLGGRTHLQGSDRPYEHLAEAENFTEILESYLHSAQGQQFERYAARHGRKFIQVVGAGSADIGDHAIAALIHDGERGVIVGNYEGRGFQRRVQDFAVKYEIDPAAALEYVLTHELGHVAGYSTEMSNERFIGEYFAGRVRETQGAMREKYRSLAGVAQQRAKEAGDTRN